MNAWSVDDAKQLYSLPFWSEGYFDVDNRGRICRSAPKVRVCRYPS